MYIYQVLAVLFQRREIKSIEDGLCRQCPITLLSLVRGVPLCRLAERIRDAELLVMPRPRCRFEERRSDNNGMELHAIYSADIFLTRDAAETRHI